MRLLSLFLITYAVLFSSSFAFAGNGNLSYSGKYNEREQATEDLFEFLDDTVFAGFTIISEQEDEDKILSPEARRNILKKLILSDADVNAKRYGRTPLMWVVRGRILSVVC